MTRYLTVAEVRALHRMAIAQTGGGEGVRDENGLESAVAQAQMTFGGQDLYADLFAKAAALGFSIISNHPFVDGNKRVGHAAMEVFLILNGWEIEGDVNDQEQLILGVASGQTSRDELLAWIQTHARRR